MACSSTTGDFGLNLLSAVSQTAYSMPERTDVNSSPGEVSVSDSDDGARTPSQSDDTYHRSTRKRRRGVIEKRRRDRINNSLSELRRLVPAAFEKQGSQKLEKAEILQLTVEHLRFLESRAFLDPQRLATDYHSMGYRECASEVARYLTSHEGMDLQEPLRMRLMSHLQCYGAQKSNNWSWPSQNYAQSTPYVSSAFAAPVNFGAQQVQEQSKMIPKTWQNSQTLY